MQTTNYYYYFRISALLAAFVVAALVLFFYSGERGWAQSTGPNIITVNTTADEANTDGDCSLREAMTAANTNAAADACPAGSATQRDAIRFDVGDEATITLGSALPTVSGAQALTINGLQDKITVSGNDTVRVFQVGSGARLGEKLTLRRLTVAGGNDEDGGGGIYNRGGTLVVSRSTFSGNGAERGGAILNNDGTLAITNSTFSGNSSSDSGAAIANQGTLTVTNSTFSGNSASGSGASDGGGGAIYNSSGTLVVTNSTFSGNSTSGSGGGIANTGTATLRNTIVANSTSGGNCSGTITDSGYNIEDGTTCGFDPSTSTSENNTNPLLDPAGLADNGGLTQTIALQAESPAIDAIPQGTNGCGTEIRRDQRGVIRPQGEGCDIGAFEVRVRRR